MTDHAGIDPERPLGHAPARSRRAPASAVQVFLGVGSNLQPESNLPAALRALHARLPVTAVSTVYITEPIDRPDQPHYRNAVWATRTHLAPEPLILLLKELEAALGRRRTADRYACRTLDLDLLLYGDRVLPHVRVPDPDLWKRAFVACPLAELAPTLLVPGSQDPIEQVAARLERSQGPLRPDEVLTQTLSADLASLAPQVEVTGLEHVDTVRAH